MTLEKAAEIFDALGFQVGFIDEGVVKAHIVRLPSSFAGRIDLHNIYCKKAADEVGEYIYAWSGTADYEDTASRCYDCVPLIKLYRDVIEHNNEMLVGAGLVARMM
jgi:hypothetical protein